ncbi:unnamed protein product [Caenorhabditis bovis]|uniref:MOSC domain-containing protein n=1 Tax=Caenorhabditis bovis TaxID=2654633 RepID=A0A8S1FBX6_9PELO|nr:unnamed protein product [Caenorhabditis bovis]
MDSLVEDKRVLLGFVGASVLGWNIAAKLQHVVSKWWNARCERNEWVPVGRIKSLHIYPIKSCKGKDVFSYKCTPLGPIFNEYFDRFFLVVDGKTGRFHTARTKPEMILTEVEIKNGIMKLIHPNHGSTEIDLDNVKKNGKVVSGFLHEKLRTDGYDCGDSAADFFSKVINEPETRLLMYSEELYTERICKTSQNWWNNPVPKRVDNTAYADLAPYMITTEASLEDLNSHLNNYVSSVNFRPCIVISDCPAWDEDKWLDLRIGDVELQCFKPCTRCVLTTVDPKTGKKDKNMQPLRKLRKYRLAPDGKLRKEFKDSPIFGVNAGLNKEGYIHVGQTVWARYKPSEF